jgi:hypothetical protein
MGGSREGSEDRTGLSCPAAAMLGIGHIPWCLIVWCGSLALRVSGLTVAVQSLQTSTARSISGLH